MRTGNLLQRERHHGQLQSQSNSSSEETERQFANLFQHQWQLGRLLLHSSTAIQQQSTT